MDIRSIWLVTLVLATHTIVAQAQSPAADSAAATAAVGSFHAALARGDAGAALQLLAPDAVILESGSVETREEYRSHHLPADMEFAQAVPARQGAMQATVSGDVAWVNSSSVTQGTFRGRAINSAGAELMVLSRTAAGWVIRAIHWSSRTLRSGG
ncbi:MAG: DUF4440 domain-containing protein [Betaproteobacteria bacterium]|nr:MAG: DUF4440 domain-containing protein [Betaproteobacteria bacterium]